MYVYTSAVSVIALHSSHWSRVRREPGVILALLLPSLLLLNDTQYTERLRALRSSYNNCSREVCTYKAAANEETAVMNIMLIVAASQTKRV